MNIPRLTRWGRAEAVRRVTELGQSARQVAHTAWDALRRARG